MTRWLLAALLAFSGCAYALSGPEPGRPRNHVPECDTSKGLVVVDGAMATGMGIATLSFVAGTEPAVALLPLAIGAIYLGGAVKGNGAVNRCRAAMDEFARYPGERFAADDDDDEPRRRRAGSRATPEEEQAAPPTTPQVGPYPQPQPGAYTQPQPGPPPPQQPQPRTQPQPQPQPPARTGSQRPRKPAAENDWSDFWREVP